VGLPPVVFHAVDSSTHVYTLTLAPFALPSIAPNCDAINRGIDEPWHFELAWKLYDTRPLLHFFGYGCGLLSGHAVLFISQMTFDLCGPYSVLTCLAYHNLPLANMLKMTARHNNLDWLY
jgi:hypothetical protein